MSKRELFHLCLIALLALAQAPAVANTTYTFTVSGTAVDNCTAPSQTDASPGINFAPFDPLNPATIRATATFATTCTDGTFVQVYLSSFTGSDRHITGTKNTSDKLYYQIYESGYATPWPTTSAGALTIGTSTGKTLPLTWTLYGQLDSTANADAAVDTYGTSSDAITMNVLY